MNFEDITLPDRCSAADHIAYDALQERLLKVCTFYHKNYLHFTDCDDKDFPAISMTTKGERMFIQDIEFNLFNSWECIKWFSQIKKPLVIDVMIQNTLNQPYKLYIPFLESELDNAIMQFDVFINKVANRLYMLTCDRLGPQVIKPRPICFVIADARLFNKEVFCKFMEHALESILANIVHFNSIIFSPTLYAALPYRLVSSKMGHQRIENMYRQIKQNSLVLK